MVTLVYVCAFALLVIYEMRKRHKQDLLNAHRVYTTALQDKNDEIEHIKLALDSAINGLQAYSPPGAISGFTWGKVHVDGSKLMDTMFGKYKSAPKETSFRIVLNKQATHDSFVKYLDSLALHTGTHVGFRAGGCTVDIPNPKKLGECYKAQLLGSHRPDEPGSDIWIDMHGDDHLGNVSIRAKELAWEIAFGNRGAKITWESCFFRVSL